MKKALRDGSDEVRAAVAEGLGRSEYKECTDLLLGLLDDRNEAVAQAAVRGLAQQGTEIAAQTLTKLLNDGQRSVDMRIEAALGLGTMDQPGVLETLQNAARTIGDEDIVTQVLNALAGREFSDTREFFQQYIGSAPDFRAPRCRGRGAVAGQGRPDRFPYGLPLGPGRGDPGLGGLGDKRDRRNRQRRQAAGRTARRAGSGRAIAPLPGVAEQESYDINTVMALVQREADPAARVAGMDLLGESVRENPTPELQKFFDQNAAPALKDAALKGETSPSGSRPSLRSFAQTQAQRYPPWQRWPSRLPTGRSKPQQPRLFPTHSQTEPLNPERPGPQCRTTTLSPPEDWCRWALACCALSGTVTGAIKPSRKSAVNGGKPLKIDEAAAFVSELERAAAPLRPARRFLTAPHLAALNPKAGPATLESCALDQLETATTQ